jgi:tRNA (uracil-5-)-methyltransferase TRM9
LAVTPQVVSRLLALNREFYGRFAEEFSDTRSPERVNIDPLNPYLRDGTSILDAGCGNGRLAERLDQEGHSLTYAGVDAVPQLIQIARSKAAALRHTSASYYLADVTSPGWTKQLQAYHPFDVVVALALLHHIPGTEPRLQVLRDLHSLLCPGGVLIMSNWQFMNDEHLRSKVVPWPTVGIQQEALEPGDALLDWKRGGTGYRYVHQFGETEVESLSNQSGFRVLNQFRADEGLNLFSVLARPS